MSLTDQIYISLPPPHVLYVLFYCWSDKVERIKTPLKIYSLPQQKKNDGWPNREHNMWKESCRMNSHLSQFERFIAVTTTYPLMVNFSLHCKKKKKFTKTHFTAHFCFFPFFLTLIWTLSVNYKPTFFLKCYANNDKSLLFLIFVQKHSIFSAFLNYIQMCVKWL